MGGTAFLIHGDFDPARATAKAPTPSLLGRLLGRGSAGISRSTFPDGRALLEFSAGGFASALVDDYRSFMLGYFPEPWPATQAVFGYLEDVDAKVYLRAEREEGQADGPWYVQLTFGGAAGLTETSAAVCAHWASTWYRERASAVAQFLQPHGFVPRRAEPLADAAFVATDRYGYADITNGEFELDWSELESEKDPESVVAEMTRQYADAIRRRTCGCQVCLREGV